MQKFKSLLRRFYDSSTRMNRSDYIIQLFLYNLCLVFFGVITFLSLGGIGFGGLALPQIVIFLLGAVGVVVVLVKYITLSMQRVVDIGINKIFSFVMFTPFCIILLIWPGEKIANKWGPPPLAPSKIKKIVATILFIFSTLASMLFFKSKLWLL